MTHPLERLSGSAARGAFALLLVATFASMAALVALDQGLRSDAAPGGIVSFELAGDVAAAAAMLASWGEAGRLRAGLSLGLDHLYLLLYPNAIALGCLLVARRLAPGALRRAAVPLAWGQYAAGLLDAVENFALIRLLLGARDPLWPALAQACAVPKFALVALGLLYAAAGFGLSLARRRS